MITHTQGQSKREHENILGLEFLPNGFVPLVVLVPSSQHTEFKAYLQWKLHLVAMTVFFCRIQNLVHNKVHIHMSFELSDQLHPYSIHYTIIVSAHDFFSYHN